ncbi:MAG: hypothetical protein WAQ08_16050 [Aquabacterium sp.]|uniref:crAss001_48 related protein n=1 Tax=Aquabacterium sp. TaxID=1872578 RepID=UPI003BB1403E
MKFNLRMVLESRDFGCAYGLGIAHDNGIPHQLARVGQVFQCDATPEEVADKLDLLAQGLRKVAQIRAGLPGADDVVTASVPGLPQGPALRPHELRVQAEKTELDGMVGRLGTFLASTAFQDVPELDQQLLTLQHGVMQLYSRVLGQRIERFR